MFTPPREASVLVVAEFKSHCGVKGDVAVWRKQRCGNVAMCANVVQGLTGCS